MLLGDCHHKCPLKKPTSLFLSACSQLTTSSQLSLHPFCALQYGFVPRSVFLLSICSSCQWVFLVSFGFAFPSAPCYARTLGGEGGGDGHELLAQKTRFVPPKMLPGPGGTQGDRALYVMGVKFPPQTSSSSQS